MIIEKITVIVPDKGRPDVILLYTNLPPTEFPFNESAVAKMAIANGHGEKYCSDNFPNIPTRIISSVAWSEHE